VQPYICKAFLPKIIGKHLVKKHLSYAIDATT
jgi:hypothetical protein